MPALPELGGAAGLVRRVEVLREVEAHKEGDAYRYIRVSGEVGVDLEGIAEQGHKVLESAEHQGVLEDTVAEIDRDVVGKYELLREAVDYPEDGDAEPVAAERIGLMELADELGRADDRARDELREEG